MSAGPNSSFCLTASCGRWKRPFEVVKNEKPATHRAIPVVAKFVLGAGCLARVGFHPVSEISSAEAKVLRAAQSAASISRPIDEACRTAGEPAVLDKLVRRGFLRPLPVKIDADGNVFQTRVLQLTAKGRSHRLPDDPLGPAAASPEASRTRIGV